VRGKNALKINQCCLMIQIEVFQVGAPEDMWHAQKSMWHPVAMWRDGNIHMIFLPRSRQGSLKGPQRKPVCIVVYFTDVDFLYTNATIPVKDSFSELLLCTPPLQIPIWKYDKAHFGVAYFNLSQYSEKWAH
jgi:hypothetical protein